MRDATKDLTPLEQDVVEYLQGPRSDDSIGSFLEYLRGILSEKYAIQNLCSGEQFAFSSGLLLGRLEELQVITINKPRSSAEDEACH